ncbi:hypothetical protein PENTCL1PPCAC_7928 [Pristionchus entomophagus]|uniref:Galectin n=1 Tax=Pristionchus entomophagus TaxID=358040 RepID=A0AAV5SYQ4_9BILA|nr:hypothetical protein PENTCL1PPCAC_7928 [Pristionchus entomophagus]
MHIDHPAIPVTIPLAHGMCDGAKVKIDGMPFAGYQNGFTVELLTQLGSLLHMDVRFNEDSIILNNFHDGNWIGEQRHKLAFCIGARFHMKIKNHCGQFTLHSNDHLIANFPHRGNPHHVTAFHIRGNVIVTKICFLNFSHPIVYSPTPAAVPSAPPPYNAPAPPVVMAAPQMVQPVYVAARPQVVVVEDHHHHHAAGAAVAGAIVGGAIVRRAVIGAAIRRRRW